MSSRLPASSFCGVEGPVADARHLWGLEVRTGGPSPSRSFSPPRRYSLCCQSLAPSLRFPSCGAHSYALSRRSVLSWPAWFADHPQSYQASAGIGTLALPYRAIAFGLDQFPPRCDRIEPMAPALGPAYLSSLHPMPLVRIPEPFDHEQFHVRAQARWFQAFEAITVNSCLAEATSINFRNSLQNLRTRFGPRKPS